MSKKVVIVGAGLFGSLAARLAMARGADVTVIDNHSEFAASKASGGLMKPSWLTRIPKEGVEAGYRVLAEVGNPVDLEFGVQVRGAHTPFKFERVTFIDPAQLEVPHRTSTVTQVGNGFVELDSGERIEASAVLVAAGIWSEQLLPGLMPPVKGIYGASLRFKGRVKQSQLDLFAPYKQAVAFNIAPNTVWMGDTTSLIEKSWGEDAVNRTIERAQNWFNLRKPTRIDVGARPYVEGHPEGYFNRVGPRTWVATGGAKNGTIIGAWHAERFVTEARL